jgi:methylglutaconyl-CoA hydratase
MVVNTFIRTFLQDNVQYILLARPEKGNAYHPEMAAEIKFAFDKIRNDKPRAVVLSAEGKNFCTGADLDSLEKSYDMSLIRDMYFSILSCPCPIIGKVFGKIRGGGIGMTASCDVVIASPETDFALTEVKHGLIPGMITPMILAKTSGTIFQDWSTSGRTFGVNEAKTSGLVTYLESEKTIEQVLAEKVSLHPFRMKPDIIESELNRYLKLSEEHRKKMIRASGIS